MNNAEQRKKQESAERSRSDLKHKKESADAIEKLAQVVSYAHVCTHAR